MNESVRETRDTARDKLIESMQLEEEDLLEDDDHPEYALRGTWQHPNPSLIMASNPRIAIRFIKRYGILFIFVAILWFLFYVFVRMAMS